eukprot:CAMPEP_0196586642 /NCGR_PEP_ID=MMETSP1081-20130531/55066_1 /TAXON_ID=36882 /ORGANISM="Pyramimonas amylifera, Strain CCMP720" /LENGTH=240 /DNA_ID=CAMNT_0041908593 /DNA_START=53 /DNA_END=773 /DNA_ORIENTATION=-
MDASSLDASRVTVYMKDALTIMLENRPQNPLVFLADYFHMVTQVKNPVNRAYRYIKLSPQDRAVFMDNLVAAFTMLESDGGSAGLTGEEYMKLLQHICADFPEETVRILFQILGKADKERVGFQDFLGGIKACMYFEEFLGEAEDLFLHHAVEEPAPGSEQSVPSTALDMLIEELASRTHVQDRQTPSSRNEFVRACREANRKLSATGPPISRVTFPQFATSLFRVLTPLPSPGSAIIFE